MAGKNWMENTNFWKGFAVVFFIVAAFMTAYSFGWLGPENVVYATQGCNGNVVAGAPPASGGLFGIPLNPNTKVIVSQPTTLSVVPAGARVVSQTDTKIGYILHDPKADLDTTVWVYCSCSSTGACGVGWAGCKQAACTGTCTLTGGTSVSGSATPGWPKIGYIYGTRYIPGSDEQFSVSSDRKTLSVKNLKTDKNENLACFCNNQGGGCGWQGIDCMPDAGCTTGCFITSLTDSTKI